MRLGPPGSPWPGAAQGQPGCAARVPWHHRARHVTLSRPATAWSISVGLRHACRDVSDRHWRLLGQCVAGDQCCEARGGSLVPPASLNPGSEEEPDARVAAVTRAHHRQACSLPLLTPSSLAPSQICLQRRSAPCRALASQRPRTARPQPHAPRLQPQSHAPRPPSCNPMHGPHGLHGWRVGLQLGCVGPPPGCAGLQAGRVGLPPGCAGLQAGRLGLQAKGWARSTYYLLTDLLTY